MDGGTGVGVLVGVGVLIGCGLPVGVGVGVGEGSPVGCGSLAGAGSLEGSGDVVGRSIYRQRTSNTEPGGTDSMITEYSSDRSSNPRTMGCGVRVPRGARGGVTHTFTVMSVMSSPNVNGVGGVTVPCSRRRFMVVMPASAAYRWRTESASSPPAFRSAAAYPSRAIATIAPTVRTRMTDGRTYPSSSGDEWRRRFARKDMAALARGRYISTESGKSYIP